MSIRLQLVQNLDFSLIGRETIDSKNLCSDWLPVKRFHIRSKNTLSKTNLSALDASLEGFVHRTLKEQQRECIRRIVFEKTDVFAVLPTGFGKSAIYQLIPKVLSHMGRTADDIKTTVAVVSPLDYIRKEQVAAIEKLNFGISAAAIGESNLNDKEIEEGRFEIVYGSAEQWLSDRWRKALQFGALHQTKVLVVDEVHTVATW